MPGIAGSTAAEYAAVTESIGTSMREIVDVLERGNDREVPDPTALLFSGSADLATRAGRERGAGIS